MKENNLTTYAVRVLDERLQKVSDAVETALVEGRGNLTTGYEESSDVWKTIETCETSLVWAQRIGIDPTPYQEQMNQFTERFYKQFS